MIYKLQKEHYKNVFNLLPQVEEMIDIKAVLQLNNPGLVLADSTSSPKSALIWTKNGSNLVGDNENHNFNEHMKAGMEENIVPIHRGIGYNGLDIGGNSHRWDETIEKIFKNSKIAKNYQLIYKYLKLQDSALKEVKLEGDYKLRIIDKDLLNENFRNINNLINEILIFWDTMDNFLEKGRGYCITKDDLILSRCTIDYVYENQRSLGISTHKDYRKKGLARAVAVELLKHCKDRHYEVIWDCTESNLASSSLAQDLGFTRICKYTMYDVTLEEV